MSESDVPVKRFDDFAVSAFFLAVFIMVLPTEADIILPFLSHGRIALGSLVAIACFTIVSVPSLISLCRHWRQPGVWRGRGYLVATNVILAINALMFGIVFFRQLAK
jgi:hypothetical protein